MQVDISIERAPGAQFDQGGLFVRFDSETWIKTGIEVVDDRPKLGCVVTNEFSDWSTQDWGSLSVRLRISQMGDGAYVIEAQSTDADPVSDAWFFIRICQLRGIDTSEGAQTQVSVGIFACCPENQVNMRVNFSRFSILPGTKFLHNADGN